MTVQFQILDADWKPEGEVIEFFVGVDGMVDLSALPDRDLADTWMHMGLPDEARNGSVFPKDGKRFLQAIMREAARNQAWRATVKK